MLFIQVTALCILFLIGLIQVIGSSIQNKKVPKKAIFLVIVPALIFGAVVSYDFIYKSYFFKPELKDIIGRYHISKVETDNIDKTSIKNYHLELRKDGTFSISEIPVIEMCNKGAFNFDMSVDFNELYFKCNGSNDRSAHIDRHLKSFAIEFVIGDPDTGESIFFEKDK